MQVQGARTYSRTLLLWCLISFCFYLCYLLSGTATWESKLKSACEARFFFVFAKVNIEMGISMSEQGFIWPTHKNR